MRNPGCGFELFSVVGMQPNNLHRTSLSAFALVFQVFYVVHATFREKDPHQHQTLRKWIVSRKTKYLVFIDRIMCKLLVLPYLALVVFASLTVYVRPKYPPDATGRLV